MAIQKVMRLAKTASSRETKILEGLESYYKGECSLGYVARRLRIPIRALMDFMTKEELPYYWDEEDAKRGLKRLSELRSTL
ncbi:MAG: hypothetical protein HYU39_04000 [Thaumarchaeota archaeon]|nr:hypothetical protein [Nitrososphaerota archaeon]